MQQRKSTLAYGTTGTTRTSAAPVSRRRRLDSRPTSDAPPGNAPSSMPPSGLRLVQPAAVPRPKMSSIPPEPTSIRALMPRVALPRPAPLPRLVAPRLEEEIEALDDADLTFIEDDAAPASARAPLPPVPWTPESTPIPANRTAPTTPPPPQVAPIATITPVASITPPAPPVATVLEAAPRWIAPPTIAAPAPDEDELLPLSPMAALRARALEAWAGASPRVRTALTFAAGFVAGGIVVAVS